MIGRGWPLQRGLAVAFLPRRHTAVYYPFLARGWLRESEGQAPQWAIAAWARLITKRFQSLMQSHSCNHSEIRFLYWVESRPGPCGLTCDLSLHSVSRCCRTRLVIGFTSIDAIEVMLELDRGGCQHAADVVQRADRPHSAADGLQAGAIHTYNS